MAKRNLYKILTGLFIALYLGAVTLSAQNDSINQHDANGEKTGLWVIYYDDGQPEKKGIYENGRKQGVWEGWFQNGNIQYEITYENGVARGDARLYYPNGTLREEGNWQEVYWVGDYKFYHPNGQAAYEWSYNNTGRREGEQRYFYPNGEKKYLGQWADGSISGHVEVYDSTGLMVQVRNYEGGQFANSSEVNVSSPAERSSMPFTGTGYHTVYRMTGEVYRRGYFRQGELEKGQEYVYDEHNTLRQIREYESGRVVRVKSGTELDRVSE